MKDFPYPTTTLIGHGQSNGPYLQISANIELSAPLSEVDAAILKKVAVRQIHGVLQRWAMERDYILRGEDGVISLVESVSAEGQWHGGPYDELDESDDLDQMTDFPLALN